jgi:hypothetical protein
MGDRQISCDNLWKFWTCKKGSCWDYTTESSRIDDDDTGEFEDEIGMLLLKLD